MENTLSRIPYTINVEEYVCSVLEQMRKMNESRDYSGLSAAIERVQYHASKMEDALYSYDGIKYSIKDALKDKDLSDADFRKKVQEIVDRLDQRQGTS